MPSSGLESIDMETAAKVAAVVEEAIKQGLLVEWLAFFVGGVQSGVLPLAAANLAAVEWDF